MISSSTPRAPAIKIWPNIESTQYAYTALDRSHVRHREASMGAQRAGEASHGGLRTPGGVPSEQTSRASGLRGGSQFSLRSDRSHMVAPLKF